MSAEFKSLLDGLAEHDMTATNYLHCRTRCKLTEADDRLVSGCNAIAAYALVVVTPVCRRPSALARAPVAGKCVPAFPRPKAGMLT